jgi:mRNA interferase MazF
VNRGDIYGVAGKGDFAGKPRPALIVQSDIFNPHHPSLTACPITTTITGDGLFRIAIPADDDSGLKTDSEVEIDKLQAVRRDRVGRRIGRASEEVMAAVDEALRRWLDL